jgi:two-component system, OmpR family, phosphate regulon sensor histidine kinase PhoR
MTNGVEAAIVDYPVLVAGLLDSVEADCAASPLEPLGRLVETVAAALGAAAGSFVVYGGGQGRVLVATEGYRWVLGRPVEVAHPSVARTLTEDCVEFDVRRDAPPELAGHLAGHGLLRAVTTRACARDRLLGVLHLYFRDPDGGPLSPAARTALQLAARLAGRVYLAAGEPPAPGGAEPTRANREVAAARAREQAKDLFVATTSHELRTPVTVVRGYAETLDRRWAQLDEPTRRDLVRAIRQRTERLAVLVDRLLLGGDDEAKIDALLAPAPFDLTARLRLATGRLPEELTGRLVVDLPERLPTAVGDAGSVATIVNELVQNAHKYSPDGGEITVTAGADEATVFFRVTDRGIGVQAEHVERAFERFWQAEGSDRRRFGGLGLGLYLVRRLVERQHGWVSLRPAEPGGTVAEVRLPRAGVASGEA